MKHGYTDDTLQDAIDAACEETAKAHEIYLNALDLKPSSQSWAEETPARLHLAEKLLELLPEASQLSTLRPIAEAGEVPAGVVRMTGYRIADHWNVGTMKCTGDTHFADIRLPESQATGVDATKSAYAGYMTDEMPEVIHEGGKVFPVAKPTPSTFTAHGKEWTPSVGDVVMLKSGGPKMTVESITKDHAFCRWFDMNGSNQLLFNVATLTKADS